MIDSSIYTAILKTCTNSKFFEIVKSFGGGIDCYYRQAYYKMHFFNDFIIQHWIKAYYSEELVWCSNYYMLFGQYSFIRGYDILQRSFTQREGESRPYKKHGLF